MELNSSIEIGGTIVTPGKRMNIDLPVADLYTSQSLHMPVQVICGRKAGPVLFISAAIHGDELNGVEIIRRLLKRKSLRSIRGTLLAVPIVNVHGFLRVASIGWLPELAGHHSSVSDKHQHHRAELREALGWYVEAFIPFDGAIELIVEPSSRWHLAAAIRVHNCDVCRHVHTNYRIGPTPINLGVVNDRRALTHLVASMPYAYDARFDMPHISAIPSRLA